MPANAAPDSTPADMQLKDQETARELPASEDTYLDDYHPTAFPEPSESFGCRVGSGGMTGWLLFGLLGAVFMLRRRSRSAS